MKILRIIYDWPPPWAGLAPHPFELTRYQIKKGHEIQILCGRWPKAGPVVTLDGLKLHTIWREPFPGTLAFTSSFLAFIKYLIIRKTFTPDFIHCHGHFAFWIYIYRKILHKILPWANELKIPLVVHFHNTVKGRWEALKKEGKYISPHARLLEWPIGQISDKIASSIGSAYVFVSEEVKKEAVKYYGIDEKRCFILESGVNTDIFKPTNEVEKDKSKKDIGLDHYDKVILNYGMIVERKNLHLLIDALTFLPIQYKLLLVGNGDVSYTQKLVKQIEMKDLKDRVIRVGYTPYPQIPIACQMADVFVLPSAWEGLPKAVIENLACETPCLVSGFRLSEEIQGIYYLDNLEPQNIAEKIKQIVENPAHVDRETIRNAYSWERKVDQLEKIYEFARKNLFV